MLSKQNITLDATNKAINYLAAKGYDPQYGARPIKRIIQKEVLNTLSKELLSGKITADSVVLIDSFNDTLVFRNQTEIA
jgi:ATP-dependent Clp protease ATP-binding subunit ClpB